MPKSKPVPPRRTTTPSHDPVKQVIVLIEDLGNPNKMKQDDYREFLDTINDELQILRTAARA